MAKSLYESRHSLKQITIFSLLFCATLISSTSNAATKEFNSTPTASPMQLAYVTAHRHVVRHPVHRNTTVVHQTGVVHHTGTVVRHPAVRHPVARHHVRHH
jgi:hypothetical protein